MVGNKYNFIYARDNYTCQRCGKTRLDAVLTLAHRIKQGSGSEIWAQDYLLKNFGQYKTFKYIRDNLINDEDNLVVACAGACNDSFNIFFNPVERDKLFFNICKKYVD